jgi:hypothetical protein
VVDSSAQLDDATVDAGTAFDLPALSLVALRALG